MIQIGSFRWRSWFAVATVFAFIASAQAQVDIFMSVSTAAPAPMGANPQTAPTLAGDSTDIQYPKWIKLYSASLGVDREVTLSNGSVTTSKPNIQNVAIMKATDSTTPSLYTLVCGGTTATTSQPIPYVTIDFRNGNGQVFYRLQMQDVYFTSASTSASSEVPSESLTLFFTKISWSYATFDSGGKSQGTVTKGWDLIKNGGF